MTKKGAGLAAGPGRNVRRLENEADRQSELPCRLEDIPHAVTASQGHRRLHHSGREAIRAAAVTSGSSARNLYRSAKGSRTVQCVYVAVGRHHHVPVDVWIAAEAVGPSPNWTDQLTVDKSVHVFAHCQNAALVKEVGDEAFERELVVLVRLAQVERVRHLEIGLKVCRGTRTLDGFTCDEVAASSAEVRLRGIRLIVTRSSSENDLVAAACGPLARRRRAHHGEAGVDGRALEDVLNHTKVGLHSEPLQPVVAA